MRKGSGWVIDREKEIAEARRLARLAVQLVVTMRLYSVTRDIRSPLSPASSTMALPSRTRHC
jgi:hypothetical protein